MSKRGRRKKKREEQMQCSPYCNYFPNMECYYYTVDENGIKRRADGKRFVCAYDGHEIKNWYDKCPLKN